MALRVLPCTSMLDHSCLGGSLPKCVSVQKREQSLILQVFRYSGLQITGFCIWTSPEYACDCNPEYACECNTQGICTVFSMPGKSGQRTCITQVVCSFLSLQHVRLG